MHFRPDIPVAAILGKLIYPVTFLTNILGCRSHFLRLLSMFIHVCCCPARRSIPLPSDIPVHPHIGTLLCTNLFSPKPNLIRPSSSSPLRFGFVELLNRVLLRVRLWRWWFLIPGPPGVTSAQVLSKGSPTNNRSSTSPFTLLISYVRRLFIVVSPEVDVES